MRDDMPWADDDFPDGTEGGPDLLELARAACRRWRGVVAVTVFTLVLAGGGLFVAVAMAQGYQATKRGGHGPCLAEAHEGALHRLQREIACTMIQRSREGGG